jgi:hypothetical protein
MPQPDDQAQALETAQVAFILSELETLSRNITANYTLRSSSKSRQCSSWLFWNTVINKAHISDQDQQQFWQITTEILWLGGLSIPYLIKSQLCRFRWIKLL